MTAFATKHIGTLIAEVDAPGDGDAIIHVDTGAIVSFIHRQIGDSRRGESRNECSA